MRRQRLAVGVSPWNADRQPGWQAARAPDWKYRVVCILQPCNSRPGAICGLLFFEGLIDEGTQPEPEVEVPLGAEELEPLTGVGETRI